ncbi:hypothetical protein [Streptosporangium roseum]|uniref:hypothetical protein n=2 Tax=Streptosporangium roseum TaxID=2001 RepID=UPI00331C6410
MSRHELSEAEYLRHLEHLAREIVSAAHGEGWITYGDDPEGVTPLQRSVNEMARQIRHYHFDSDGCLDPELPILKLAGVVVLQPHALPLGMDETYNEICARLGVEARPEGWAIWNTWAEDGRSISIILVDSDATEGILMNWMRGIEVYPVTPLPAQVTLTRQGWVAPMTLSPFSARKLGATRPVYWSPGADSDASSSGTPAQE